jgi:glutamine amidotransferase
MMNPMTSLETNSRNVAIVDYGMGNLFSVAHACERSGLAVRITSSAREISSADAVILPGVGAFGNAMEAIKKLDLVGVLQDISVSSKPLMGICLGMHLLMDEGHEFGCHEGLKIIPGVVDRFEDPKDGSGRVLKVPEVQWNRIYRVESDPGMDPWSGTLLDGVAEGEYMYFVHSFYAAPTDPLCVFSVSRYGRMEFCSSIRRGSVFACQFHSERSGGNGLRMYRNLFSSLGSD